MNKILTYNKLLEVVGEMIEKVFSFKKNKIMYWYLYA